MVLICFFLCFVSFSLCSSFSPTVTLSQLDRMTPLVVCLTSEPTKSWPCIRTTTSYAASHLLRFPNLAVSYWLATTISIATCGTLWGQNEQVRTAHRWLCFWGFFLSPANCVVTRFFFFCFVLFFCRCVSRSRQPRQLFGRYRRWHGRGHRIMG